MSGMFFATLRLPVVCQPARSSSRTACAPRATTPEQRGAADFILLITRLSFAENDIFAGHRCGTTPIAAVAGEYLFEATKERLASFCTDGFGHFEGQPMTKNTHFNTWYWVAAIVGIMLVQYVVSTARQIAPIPYSEFQQLLRDGKVAELGISDRFIQGALKQPLPGGQTRFATTRVDPDFAQELQQYGVKYTGQVESTLVRDILSW